MTRSRAERIIGCEVFPLEPLGLEPKAFHGRTWRAMDGGTEIARVTEPDDDRAWDRLVQVLYQRRSLQAFEEQGWQCLQCSGYCPLQSHHVIPRARGRLDIRSNLVGLCPECHDSITQNRVKLVPNPHVLEAVFDNSGLRWTDSGWVRE